MADPASSGPDVGSGLAPGARHYRAFVGATETYDLFAHMQFSLMTLLGLREQHTLLDVGCGSLRGGKLFVVYLLPERYFGIEPEDWLIQEGIERELTRELVAVKRPRFLVDRHFSCTSFGVRFDFVLAQSILSHSPRAQIARCLSQVRAVMKPESLFVASFVEAETDYQGGAWVYPGVVGYRARTLEGLAAEVGLSTRRLDWFHAGGQTWLLFFLPGIEPRIEMLASLNQALPLKEQLLHYRARSDRLAVIEAHPLYRILSRCRRWSRGLWRAVRRSE